MPLAVLPGLCFNSISAQYWIAAPVSQHSNTHLKNRVDFGGPGSADMALL